MSLLDSVMLIRFCSLISFSLREALHTPRTFPEAISYLSKNELLVPGKPKPSHQQWPEGDRERERGREIEREIGR